MKTQRHRRGQESPTPSPPKPKATAGGQSLPAGTQAHMGAAFGHDFSSVRVFADETSADSAQEMDAAAYAVGSDVFFNRGFYQPDTNDGRHLLAHELTHVVQQARFGSAGAQTSRAVSDPGDPAEREAESVAGQAAAGRRVQVQAAPQAPVARFGLFDWAKHKAADAWHGAEHVASGAVHSVGNFASGALHGAEHVGSGLAHGIQHAGAGLMHGVGSAWHGAQRLVSGVGHGVSNLAHRVGNGVGHAWNNARHFGSNALHGAEHLASNAVHGLGRVASRGLHGAERVASRGLHTMEHMASGAWRGARHVASEGLHGAERVANSAARGVGHAWNNARHFGTSALHRGEALAARGLHGAEHLALGAAHGITHAGSGLMQSASGALHGAEQWGAGALHNLGSAASTEFAPLLNAKNPWEALKAEGSIAYDGMKKAGGWVKSGGEAVTHDIDWMEDKEHDAAHWAADKTNGIPVLSQLAHGAADLVDTQTQLTGGLLKAGTGLVEGVAGMVVNPVDTLKGLEAMGEHIPTMGGLIPNPLKAAHGLLNVATGSESWAEMQKSLSPGQSLKDDGQFWKNVGGGLISGYSDSWKKGKYADVAGHALGDIGSLFIGAGEAGAVAKVSEVAKAADVADIGRMAEAAKAGDAAKLGEGADAARLAEGAKVESPLAKAGAGAKPPADPWGDIGLGKAGNQKRFASDMTGLQKDWPGLSTAEREQRLTEMINKPLGKSGVKSIERVGPKADGGGVFDFRTWDIGADGDLMSKPHLGAGDAQELGNTVYHEGRHAEQWYGSAREGIARAGEGRPLLKRMFPGKAGREADIADVSKRLGIPEDVVAHAHTPWKRLTYFGKDRKFGSAMHDAVYSPAGGANRSATYAGMDAAEASYGTAHTAHEAATAERAAAQAARDQALAEHQMALGNASATDAEKAAAQAALQDAESKLATADANHATAQATRDQAIADWQASHAAYKALPEEADAWRQGDAVGERIADGQPATSSVSTAAGGGASSTTGAPRIPEPNVTPAAEGSVPAPAMAHSPSSGETVPGTTNSASEADQLASAKAAEEEAIRQRMQELETQGHGPARHGSQVTDQQLEDRATKGYDPVTGSTDDAYLKNADGTPRSHAYGRDATKITSDAAYVKGESHLRDSQAFKDATATANGAGDDTAVVENIRLEDIYGPDYLKHVAGKTRIGSKNNPTGSVGTDFTDGTLKGVYRRDASGEWGLHTMYPEPGN